jgi:sec-independent protein translocase protein TatA
MFGSIGMLELMVILVIALVFFGPGKLPELGSMIGKAIRTLKKEMDTP